MKQLHCPVVLIGGTNGKGSTCEFLLSILSNAGYKVGITTSPHIHDICERVRVILPNQYPLSVIGHDELISAMQHVEQPLQNFFTTITLAAFHLFDIHQVDIAILEVGIGGRLDPTNICNPTVSAITTVDYDHMNKLGNTLNEIGLEKAHIYRSGHYGLFGDVNIPESVIEYAALNSVNLQIFGQNFGYRKHDVSFDVWVNMNGNTFNYYCLPAPGMRGIEQLKNASLSIAIIFALNITVPIASIKYGLLKANLPGRFQVLPGALPQVIVDVAHNPQGAATMMKNLSTMPYQENNYAVFSVANDKDISRIIALCAKYFTHWFIAPIASNRAVSNEVLKSILLTHGIFSCNIFCFHDIIYAYIAAKQHIDHSGRIVCFGSFLVAQTVLSVLNQDE